MKKNIEQKRNEKKNRNIYYIYMVGFFALLFLLVGISVRGEKQKENNSKKVQKEEKNQETLSKNVKNVENNYDSHILERYNVDINLNNSSNAVSKNEKDKKKVTTKQKKNSSNAKRVYLTFDDGPSENTSKILSILEKYDAKATFFVVYRKGDNNKKLYKRIVDEGHTIGIHSFTHNYKNIYSSEKAFCKDVVLMRNYIYKVTGVKTNFYRFPGGSGNSVSKVDIRKCIKFLNKESIIYYDWNVENGDATGKKLSDKQLINNVVKNVKTKNTPIVLMHDAATKNSTVRTLPTIIKILKKQGYEFAGIDENTPRIQQKK